MANTAIMQGMAFDEVISAGTSENLFSSIKWTGVDKIEFDMREGVDSDFNTLLKQTQSTDQETQDRAVDALCSLLNDWTKGIDSQIISDLAAQSAARQKQNNISLASQLEPSQASSAPLYNLIATDSFKKAFEQS